MRKNETKTKNEKRRKESENGNSKRTVDTLKRRLLKLGIYSAPIIASISIPDIKIEAQTPTEEPCGPDIPAPIFRKKNIMEEEKGKERSSNTKIKRIGIKSIYERSRNLLKSPFKKSSLKTKEDEEKE